MIINPFVFGVAAWEPADLFSASEPGFAYDFSDSTGIYTDSARTTLVTTAGDLIGSVSDISGNANHAPQATTANKMAWQTTYAGSDGFDDFLDVPTIDFTGTDKLTIIVGTRKTSDASIGFLVGNASLSTGNAGDLSIYAPFTPSANKYAFRVRGSGSQVSAAFGTSGTAPDLAVLTVQADMALADGSQVTGRRNTGAVTTGGTGAGSGVFRNAAWRLGRRGDNSSPFGGRIYRVIVIGRVLTADELLAAQTWCNDTTAAY